MKTNIFKKITSYFTLSIFTVVMSVGPVHAGPAPAAVGLAISPISQAVAAGQTVSYSIMANNDQPTYAMQFSVSYDPALLTLNNVVPGSGTSSWSMEKNTNLAGTIKLGFYNNNPLALAANPQQVALVTFTVKSTIPSTYNPKIEIVPTVNPDQTIPVMFGIDGFNEADLAAGQITNGTISVTVPNVPPTVSITGPASAVTLPSSVFISGSAADSDGSISKVEIYNGATKLGDATLSGSSYSFTWAGVVAGTYFITAKATDNSAAVSTSSTFSVTVNPKANVAPTVSVTGPASAVTLPSNVIITGSASDSDGSISKVEIYNGATKLGDATLSGSSYSFTWAGAIAGTYSITAKATDNSAAVSTSSILSVTVNPIPNVAPIAAFSVDNTAPLTGKYTSTSSDSDGTIDSYSWDLGDGTSATTASVNHVYASARGYTVKLTVTDNKGATNTLTQNVTINAIPNLAPSVSVTGPASAITLPSSVIIIGSASDSDGSISKVEIFNGATKLGDATLSGSSYSFTWTGAIAGTFSITAKATDNSGATTTSSTMSVTVNPKPNVSPTVSVTGPASAVTLPSSVVIAGSASDSDGSISKVEIFNGATKLGDATISGSSYSFTWAGVVAGTYSITAKATDNSGATTTSSTMSVTVNPKPNELPSVSLTGPLSATTLPASVVITGTANDSDGSISKVEIFNGATKLGEATLSGNSHSFTWAAAAGTYSMTAKATDNSGATTTSSTMSVTVNPKPNEVPSVSLSGPLSATTLPASVMITGTASDNDGSISKVEIFNGATKLGEATLSGNSHSFTWAAAAGTYSITAKATDNSGATTTSSAMSVTVNPKPNELPSVSLTGPLSATTLPASVVITGTANDSDGSISKVEIFNGATKLGEATISGNSHSFTWAAAAGTHSITAKAMDNSGATVTSSAMSVTVNPKPIVAPVVSLTGPVTATTLPDSVTITGNASDDESISRVEIYNGLTKLGNAILVGSSYSFVWAGAAGTHSITAKATDNDGNTTISSVMSLTVNPKPNEAPTAVIGSAPEGMVFIDMPFRGGDSKDPDGSISSYSWDFGDATSSTEMNPRHTYSTIGNYTVSLVVKDNNGLSSVAVSKTITVNPKPNRPPVARISSDVSEGTVPVNVGFRGQDSADEDPEGSIKSHRWDFGDGEESSEVNPKHTYRNAGTYTTTLTVIDDKGATHKVSKTIKANSVIRTFRLF